MSIDNQSKCHAVSAVNDSARMRVYVLHDETRAELSKNITDLMELSHKSQIVPSLIVGHLGAWDEMAKTLSNDEVSLVVEDATYCCNTPYFFESMKHLPALSDWDICQLFREEITEEAMSPFIHFYHVNSEKLNPSVYLLTKSGATKLTSESEQELRCISSPNKSWKRHHQYSSCEIIPRQIETFSKLIVDLGGYTGIGNQMFMYASLKALSIKKGMKLVVYARKGDNVISSIGGPRQYALDNFQYIRNWQELACIEDINAAPNIWKESTESYDSNINGIDPTKGDWNIHGYLQSALYFEEFAPLIRRIFKFDDSIKRKCQSWLSDTVPIDRVPIAVHLRLPNLSTESPETFVLAFPTKTFLFNSINYMQVLFPDAFFVLCSNDVPKAKSIYGDNLEGFAAWAQLGNMEDMCLMSLCDHFILSASTYAFWAAYLCDNPNKRVIMAKQMFNIKTGREMNNRHTIGLPEWLRYDLETNVTHIPLATK